MIKEGTNDLKIVMKYHQFSLKKEPRFVRVSTRGVKIKIMSSCFALVFGSNREGQAGIGLSTDEDILLPRPIHATANVRIEIYGKSKIK